MMIKRKISKNQWVWGFSRAAEKWNGRLAMLAFIIVIFFRMKMIMTSRCRSKFLDAKPEEFPNAVKMVWATFLALMRTLEPSASPRLSSLRYVKQSIILQYLTS